MKSGHWITRSKRETVSIADMIRNLRNAIFELSLGAKSIKFTSCQMSQSLPGVPLHRTRRNC
jgi:hypothetical protein